MTRSSSPNDALVRIFVGSDIWQKKAGMEDVLAASIERHATVDFQIHFMRAGPPGHEDTAPGFEVSPDGRDGTWNIGRPIHEAWTRRGWATPFSCFRMAVPELAGFAGKAIYVDSDMIFCADVAELYNQEQSAPWKCISAKRTDCSLIQCEPFGRISKWPPIERMKNSKLTLWQYREFLKRKGLMDTTLDPRWDELDIYVRGKSKLVHYTRVPTQPWRPYPGVVYRPHPDKAAYKLWKRYDQEVRENAQS